jgi:hypothetical protein
MDANGADLRRQIEEWQREIDELVAQDFTRERSRRVDELQYLRDRAWEQLDPNGIGRLDGDQE